MTEVLLDGWWRLLHAGARHPVASALALLWSYLTLPGWLLGAGLAAITASIALSGARRRLAPTLADDVKFVYRKAYLRIRWHKLCRSAGLEEARKGPTGTEGVALHRPRLCHAHFWQLPLTRQRWLTRIVQTPTGMRLTVDGTTVGMPLEAFEGKAGAAIGSTQKARDTIVKPHPKYGYMTTISLIYRDPFDVIIRPSDLPVSMVKGVVNVGRDSFGGVVTKDVRLAQLKVGNLGSGKSSETWTTLDSLIKQNLPMRVRFADPKGGMEFSIMAKKAYDYEADPTELDKFLGRALADLAKRQSEMAALGWTNWEPNNPDFPLEKFPLDVMVIDELVTFIDMMDDAKIKINGKEYKAIKAFRIYLTQIRAAGFTVDASSQLAQKEVIGVLRDLFTYKTCLRVGSAEIVRIVLGDPKLYPAHQLPPGDENSGIGYTDSGEGPMKYRAALLSKKERTGVADAIGEMSKQYMKPVKVPTNISLVSAYEPDESELVTNGATK